MKKHSIFIITLLLLAGLAGCAGQEPDKTKTEYPSTVSGTSKTVSASKVIDSSPAGTVSSSAERKNRRTGPAGNIKPGEAYFGANAEACKTAESRIFFAPSGRRTAAERATAGKYTA